MRIILVFLFGIQFDMSRMDGLGRCGLMRNHADYGIRDYGLHQAGPIWADIRPGPYGPQAHLGPGPVWTP